MLLAVRDGGGRGRLLRRELLHSVVLAASVSFAAGSFACIYTGTSLFRCTQFRPRTMCPTRPSSIWLRLSVCCLSSFVLGLSYFTVPLSSFSLSCFVSPSPSFGFQLSSFSPPCFV